jgi:hypothetical protein
MDCPDCGRPMIIIEQKEQGNDTFKVIETQWACLFCEWENETEVGFDESN